MSRDLVRACAIGRAATLRRGPGPAGVRADGLFSPAGWDTPTWAQATCGGRVPTCRANACGGRPAATSVSRTASAHGLRKSGPGGAPRAASGRAQGDPAGLACRLTRGLLVRGLGGVSDDGLADVVAGSVVPVCPSGWASRAGMGGFRCTGRPAGLHAEVAKPAPDPGRGQSF